MRSTLAFTAATSLLASQMVGALDLKTDDQQSIKDAASTIAKDLMSYYTGDKDKSQIGMLPQPYYWWEAGGLFGNMVRYGGMTGDKQYESVLADAIYSQVAPHDDFLMPALIAQLGNDDQAFWGLTAMEAVEQNLPVPSGAPQDIWLTAASNTFDELISRWNTTFCGGGIKWQFTVANNGFKYKSSIANAATLQLGARLALHTKNQTFADKATQIWDWMEAVGYISDSFQVFDGAGDDPDNCTKIDPHEWSYNSASLIGGAAAMANYSSSNGKGDAQTWSDRATGLWKHASDNFFKDGVLYEQPCEDVGTCNTDQKSFKSYLAKWSVMAGQLVPSMMCDVQSKLQTTAAALAKSCTGNGGSACGEKWYDNAYSGSTGVGEEMSALEVVIGLLSGDGCSGSAPSTTNTTTTSSAASASSSAASTAAPSSSSEAAKSSAAASTAASSSSSGAASAAPAAITSAAQAAISAGANPTLISQALAAASNPAALTSALAAAVTEAANPAAVSSAIARAYGAAPAAASNDAQPAPAAATSAAAQAAISAGANPTLISQTVAAAAAEAAISQASNPAAVSSAIAAVATSCEPVIVTVTSTSVSFTVSQTPVLSTPEATVRTSAVPGVPAPSAGVYGGSSGNGTRPAVPVSVSASAQPHAPTQSIAQASEGSGLRRAGWMVLALPIAVAAML